MSFLIDTNVLAEIRKKRPHEGVVRWFGSVEGVDLFLSVLVLGEVHQGVVRLRRRDPQQASVHEAWLSELRRRYSERILPITDAIALEWGRLNAGDPLPVVDGLMAATARVHGLILVTRNVDDFARSEVSLLDPFQA